MENQPVPLLWSLSNDTARLAAINRPLLSELGLSPARFQTGCSHHTDGLVWTGRTARGCWRRGVLLGIVLILLSLFGATTQGAATGNLGGRVLTAGDRRVMILSPAGEVLWQYPTQLTHDVWMLGDGHVLFADGETVTEVTPEKKVVFQYRAQEQKGGGTYSCQRLANGDTLVGETPPAGSRGESKWSDRLCLADHAFSDG